MRRHWSIIIFWVGPMVLLPTARSQTVADQNLRVQTFARGLQNPTGVAFLNSAGDALITQKNDGKVLLLRDRRIIGTALDLPVANESEEGLLSIALAPDFATSKIVYLYHTTANADGGTAIAHRISRYTWNGTKLTFERDVIDLPVTPGPNHNGGKIMFDSKGKLYAVVGDLNRQERTANFENASAVSRSAAIIRIQPKGGAIATNPFAGTSAKRKPQDDIYAYGIRNSFGIAFDPVNGALWDTENGPDKFDEINRVSPGFNSGWRDIMGPQSRNGGSTGTLVSLGAKAAYSDPEFSWADPVAPTDLHFLNSSRLGSEYRNDLFVGDVKTGTIFHFDLNAFRSALALTGDLTDRVADNSDADRLAEQQSLIFGSGFGIVSDLLTGPGGMYVLSLSNGKLFRISETPAAIQGLSLRESVVPEPSAATIVAFLTSTLLVHARRIRRRWLCGTPRRPESGRIALSTAKQDRKVCGRTAVSPYKLCT